MGGAQTPSRGVSRTPQSMVGEDTAGWMAPRPQPSVPGGVTGVTPWQMGEPEPPYNGGVRRKGLGGSSPCGLGGRWVFWGDVTSSLSPFPPCRGVQWGDTSPHPAWGGVSIPWGMAVDLGCPHPILHPTFPHVPATSTTSFSLFPPCHGAPLPPAHGGLPLLPRVGSPWISGVPAGPQLAAGPLAVAGRLGRDLPGLWSHQIKPSGGAKGLILFLLQQQQEGGGGPSLGSVLLSRTPQQHPRGAGGAEGVRGGRRAEAEFWEGLDLGAYGWWPGHDTRLKGTSHLCAPQGCSRPALGLQFGT